MIHFLTFAVSHFLAGKIIHHRFGNLIAGTTPNIHHFVVALAVGHQTLAVLVFDFFHLGIGFGQQLGFFLRYFHIVNTNRDAAFGRKAETGIHQMVGENHRVTQAAQAE